MEILIKHRWVLGSAPQSQSIMEKYNCVVNRIEALSSNRPGAGEKASYQGS